MASSHQLLKGLQEFIIYSFIYLYILLYLKATKWFSKVSLEDELYLIISHLLYILLII